MAIIDQLDIQVSSGVVKEPTPICDFCNRPVKEPMEIYGSVNKPPQLLLCYKCWTKITPIFKVYYPCPKKTPNWTFWRPQDCLGEIRQDNKKCG